MRISIAPLQHWRSKVLVEEAAEPRGALTHPWTARLRLFQLIILELGNDRDQSFHLLSTESTQMRVAAYVTNNGRLTLGVSSFLPPSRLSALDTVASSWNCPMSNCLASSIGTIYLKLLICDVLALLSIAAFFIWWSIVAVVLYLSTARIIL